MRGSDESAPRHSRSPFGSAWGAAAAVDWLVVGVGPPFLDLVPHDLRIQMFGNTAVITFHLWPDSPSIGRRTLVLRKHNGRRLIVHLHASMAEH